MNLMARPSAPSGRWLKLHEGPRSWTSPIDDGFTIRFAGSSFSSNPRQGKPDAARMMFLEGRRGGNARAVLARVGFRGSEGGSRKKQIHTWERGMGPLKFKLYLKFIDLRDNNLI